ncbi:apolipoprotein N-acyltransferase [Neisseria sp. HSC-16F19]|nr:hypothetical protein [Neisseria sp. HSC-16F19]MCP2041537.1 apolipoprotein N-acyltransferase [Neisseria sp. HSC-16F19]
MGAAINRIYGQISRVLSKPFRVFNFIIGLLFLPTRWRRWLFGTGTRGLKVLNIAILFGWTASLMHSGFGELSTYAGFAKLPVGIAGSLLVAVALLLAWALYDNSIRGRLIGGTALILAGLIWLLVGISFWMDYPPLHPGMVMYPILSGLSVLAGDHLRDMARLRVHLDKTKGA